MLVFILMGAVSASENVTDTSTNGDVVTGDVLASPDNSQASSVANSNVGNVTNVTKNNNSNLLSSPNNGGGSVLGAPDDSFTALQSLINSASPGSTVSSDVNNALLASPTDGTDLLGAPDDSFTALQAIIDNAAAGSTITLDRNYKFYSSYDIAYERGITIANGLTIYGSGYTIDGSNRASIFNIQGAAVLYDINFINGNGPYQNGGAIYIGGGGIPNGDFNVRATDSYGSDGFADWTRSSSGAKQYTDSQGRSVAKLVDANIYQTINFDAISTLYFSVSFASSLCNIFEYSYV